MYIPDDSSFVSRKIAIASTTSALHLITTHGANEPSATSWSSLIGIITAIVGNILISFALNIQRYAHLRLEREYNDTTNGKGLDGLEAPDSDNIGMKQNGKSTVSTQHDETTPLLSRQRQDQSQDHNDDDRERQSFDSGSSGASTQKKSYLKSPLWWAGISLMVVGEAGNFLAYGFAPASIVSPLGVVALISNCLIAPIFLHEKFRKRDPLGVLVAVGGAVTVVLSAQGSNPRLGPDEILDLVKRWEFLTYLGICVVLIVCLMIASNRFGERSIAIDMGLVGLLGGFTALSTKGIASLLSNKVWRVLTYPISYVLVLVLVLTAVGQIKYVNRALARFDATRVIPAQFVAFTIGVIVGSTILYRDFEKATTADIAQFIGGCAMTFLGVWIITSGRGSDDDNDNDENHNCEEESNLIAPEVKTNPRTNPNAIIMVDNDPPPSSSIKTTSAPDLPTSTASSPSTPRARPQVDSMLSDVDSPSSFTTARSSAPTPAKPRLPSHAISDPALPPPAMSTSTRPQPSSSNTSYPSNLAASLPNSNTNPTIAPRTDSSGPRDAIVLPPSTIHPSPSQSVAVIPSTPPNNNNPMNPQILVTPRPPTSAASRRSFLLSRESFSELIPKPFTSPLSGGLSVVVADAARRDELRRGNSLKRGRSYRKDPASSTGVGSDAQQASHRQGDGRDQDRRRSSAARSDGPGEGNSRTL